MASFTVLNLLTAALMLVSATANSPLLSPTPSPASLPWQWTPDTESPSSPPTAEMPPPANPPELSPAPSSHAPTLSPATPPPAAKTPGHAPSPSKTKPPAPAKAPKSSKAPASPPSPSPYGGLMPPAPAPAPTPPADGNGGAINRFTICGSVAVGLMAAALMA